MEIENIKTTSRIAIASIICILAAIALGCLFCVATCAGIHEAGGVLVAGIVLFSTAAFASGILALVVIAFRHKELKGGGYAILGMTLAAPVMLAMASSFYVAMVRAEKMKTNTGLYNLKLLGKELVKYAEGNDGYLPVAHRWCDLLMEHNSKLTRDNFRHPKPERFQLQGDCHFAFNKNVGGLRLADIRDDVVLIFEADGDWNLNGTSELLKTRYEGEHSNIAVLFVDQTVSRYWYNMNAARKFDSRGMRYERLRWKPNN